MNLSSYESGLRNQDTKAPNFGSQFAKEKMIKLGGQVNECHVIEPEIVKIEAYQYVIWQQVSQMEKLELIIEGGDEWWIFTTEQYEANILNLYKCR